MREVKVGLIQETNHWEFRESPDLIYLRSKWGGPGLAFADWDAVQEVCSILFHALPPSMRPWMPEGQARAAGVSQWDRRPVESDDPSQTR